MDAPRFPLPTTFSALPSSLFSTGWRIQVLPINGSWGSDLFPGAFYLTKEEAAGYFWTVLFSFFDFVPHLVDISCCWLSSDGCVLSIGRGTDSSSEK